jgi:hypothetical protein
VSTNNEQPMSELMASSVYVLLCIYCGAPTDDDSAADFVLSQTSPHFPTEYRFQGHLGFGGKFWRNDERWYVTCYPEDETPKRLEMIEKTNRILEGSRALHMGKGRPNIQQLPRR